MSFPDSPGRAKGVTHGEVSSLNASPTPVGYSSQPVPPRHDLCAHPRRHFPPPPVKIGRMSAWLDREMAAVNEALIQGQSDAEIRQLVADLVAKRTEGAN